jgi:hypothetical protein
MGIFPLLNGYFPEGSFVWLTFCYSVYVMQSRNLEDVGNIHSGLGHLDPQALLLKKAPEYAKRELASDCQGQSNFCIKQSKA